ncbi:Suf-domain-containing protein [Laetiporus sulphureus 93-53]|uniref:mRNA 3'-end-processing protein RNA14 n=1 Tax=Laetiporus sulphureus 93-53 TaxID=1314785 RepID=A0A165ILD4_9APHY|nr:Suf-domain-containing protein [Laetiporus sulphureus 93-53]KZT13241.1 Suf-domain-containing protein [Laetiporus sulphureus 93-53]
MSEPPQKPEDLTDASLFADDEKTQPAEDDILNVVRQINPDSLARSSSLSDNVSTVKQEPTPPPTSEYDQLRAQLRQKPFEADTWLRLVDIAEDSGDIEKIKETYEGLLEAYPNTSSVQIAYLNHFLDNPETFGFAESLFKRFLRTSSSVDLWKFYLTYVRRVNTGPNARDVIRKSYEYALNHIGQDKDSSEIWTDYIQFLKSGETTTTWEEQQKMDAIRKAYSRAVQIPMESVKKLWEEYQDFENGLNKITAKKFLSDLQQGHMQARTVLNQLQEHLTVLFPPPPPSRTARPPIWLPRQPTFTAGDKALVGRWRGYLKWEEGNPLEIEEKDKGTLHSRLQAVYRKAIVRMRFFSEIWYMAYVWTNSIGKTDEALAILKAGIDANPSSFVLNFAYAEALEIRENYTEVHATFTKFLDVLRQDLEAVERRVSAENSPSSTAPNSQQEPLILPSQFSSFVSQVSEERPSKNKELHERRTEYGIAWIMYMRFARRAEGLKSSRAVFGKARRDRWMPWEVFEAAALMEYHCTKKTDVASRIFEKGMETFGDEVEFVIRYLGFLISLNDDNNARALFERVVGTFPPDRARPLWERWGRYVYQFGDLDASRKLEARMAEAYPTDPPIKRFAERYKYLGTDAIAVRDLGFNVSRQGSMNHGRTNGSTLGRTDTQMSLMSTASTTQGPAITGTSTSKRAQSPDHRRRDESRVSDFGPPPKRQRPASRERDRWEGPRRRHGTPPWERDRDREGIPRRFSKEEKEEEKPVVLPPVLSWFISVLPEPTAFDGPVFRTDDLMQVFRNAVIPSTSSVSRVRTPPPPPRAGGRPPPDYGPYQGPGRRGRF